MLFWRANIGDFIADVKACNSSLFSYFCSALSEESKSIFCTLWHSSFLSLIPSHSLLPLSILLCSFSCTSHYLSLLFFLSITLSGLYSSLTVLKTASFFSAICLRVSAFLFFPPLPLSLFSWPPSHLSLHSLVTVVSWESKGSEPLQQSELEWSRAYSKCHYIPGDTEAKRKWKIMICSVISLI